MSEDSSGGGFENTIRAAYDRLPEIEQKRKNARYIKWLVPLATVAILLLGLRTLWNTAHYNVVDRGPELRQHFQTRLGQIIPRIERQTKASADILIPRLQKELEAARTKAAESFSEELEKYTKGMGDKLEKMMSERVAATLATVAKQQRDKLANTFPEHLKCQKGETPAQCEKKEAELDRIMDEIQRSYRDWAIQELRTTFAGHLEAMDSIRQTMAEFDKPRLGKDGKPVPASVWADSDAPQNLVMLFLEIASETLGGSDDFFEGKEGK